jgi:hypothetical protein
MEKEGIYLTEDGEVGFYPLTALGVPNYMGKAMVVRDVEAAVRRTAHIKDSVDASIDKGKNILDGMTQLGRLLRAGARGGADPETIQDALDTFDIHVKPYMPGQKGRKPTNALTIKLMESLQDIRDEIEGGDFNEALKARERVNSLVEGMIVGWNKQKDRWQSRRKMMLEVRNMVKKHPEAVAEIVTASVNPRAVVARELLLAARDLMGHEREAAGSDFIKYAGAVMNLQKATAKWWRAYLSALNDMVEAKINDEPLASKSMVKARDRMAEATSEAVNAIADHKKAFDRI